MSLESVPSKPEERFIEIFQDVFGLAAAAQLTPQYPFRDISGKDRYIDFALDSLLDRYAIEIDGETFHHPSALSSEDYNDQLLRQNSLVHYGWRVLRWTDWQIANNPDEVKDHLSLMLDEAVRLAVPQEYLPAKRGSLIELHEHQKDALDQLAIMRTKGDQIALITHAVGAGKTTTAIEDARALGLRTLFLVHTEELVQQALERFAQLWREATISRLGSRDDRKARIVVGTVQLLSSRLREYAPNDWGYIVVDEAHHATARSYRAVLRYFNPQFLLGLTGTPERADGQDLLEVFQNTAHRMDMKTAVEKKILCDVRCFRVETNVDLSRLRFNGSLYNQKDLEKDVSIPERNALIVDTYSQNTPNRPCVTFCVSVNHADVMARKFIEAGFPARSVSGRLPKKERAEILKQYADGGLKVLCACDVLNEGWNSPQTEVLLMARPTLSKVIYQQQIGRGMRTHPGKKYLVLFDFVDAFGKHNISLNAHRLTSKPRYRPGERIFGTEQEGDSIDLPLHLWATDYTPVNLFDWQTRIEGMVTAGKLSELLRKDEQWVSIQWKSGKLRADEIIELGDDRLIPYFRLERLEEIREIFKLPIVTETNLYEHFKSFIDDMDMSMSYKPVWFLAVLYCADEKGKSSASCVTQEFKAAYLRRREQGLMPEKSTSPLSAPETCSDETVRAIISRNPFRRFKTQGYIDYSKDKAYFQIARPIWMVMQDKSARNEIEQICHAAIIRYYQRLN